MVWLQARISHCTDAATHMAILDRKILEQIRQMEGAETEKLTPMTYTVRLQDGPSTVFNKAESKWWSRKGRKLSDSTDKQQSTMPTTLQHLENKNWLTSQQRNIWEGNQQYLLRLSNDKGHKTKMAKAWLNKPLRWTRHTGRHLYRVNGHAYRISRRWPCLHVRTDAQWCLTGNLVVQH